MLNLIFLVLAVSISIAHGQTTARYCPNGYYRGYTSTAQRLQSAPILTVGGVSSNRLATSRDAGYYNSSSAEECWFVFVLFQILFINSFII